MAFKNFLRALLAALILIALMVVSYFTGRATRPPKDVPVARLDTAYIVRDTFIHDTTFIPYPVPVASRELDDSIDIPLPVVEETTDTVLRLPRTQVEYGDSTYHAWVSGYEPSLDSISIMQTNHFRTIERTITKTTYKHWNWGPSAGIGLTPQGVQPYVGFGLTYRF